MSLQLVIELQNDGFADRHRDGMQKVYVQTKFSAPPCEGSPKLTEY